MSGALGYGDAMALATSSCAACGGLGRREVYRHASRGGGETWREVTCACVYRNAFRACWRRYRECLRDPDRNPTRVLTASGRHAMGFVRAEYCADFELCGLRSLGPFPLLAAVFREHFIGAGDWIVCCAKLRMNRGAFFSSVYRVEERLGGAFLYLEPYGLFPRDYFSGRVLPEQKAHSRTSRPLRWKAMALAA